MRPVALILPALIACKPPAPATPPEPVTLRIAAINDFHGGLYEQRDRKDNSVALGGLPWLVGAMDSLRAQDPELLVLDGGDLFQGSWTVNATKGRGSVDALAMVGLDAAAVGNHEFDYGGIEGGHPLRGALEAQAARAPFAWLSANIYQGDERYLPEGIAPWVMLHKKGLKIAVIGLTTVETPQTTLLAGVADLTFLDGTEAVNRVLPEVQAQNPDVMVLVAHLTGQCAPKAYLELGEPCRPNGEIGRLLDELPAGTFDVMVLGHAHTLLAHREDDTFLLENRANGHAIGLVDLVVGRDGVDLDASTLHEPWGLTHEPVDPGCDEGEYDLSPRDVGGRLITPSAEALALVRTLEAEAGSLCSEIGCSDKALTRSRTAESEVGNVVADASLQAIEGADFAIANSGGLRADLPMGTLRREDMQAVMPFDNRLFAVKMTGEQVRTLFRLGSAGAHGLLQVSGASYHFDDTITGGSDLDGDGTIGDWERDRLCSVQIGGAPLDPEATYTAIVTDFLYGGGDHMAHAFEGTTVTTEGPLLREVLYDYPSTLGACLPAATSQVDPAHPRVRIGPCGD